MSPSQEKKHTDQISDIEAMNHHNTEMLCTQIPATMQSQSQRAEAAQVQDSQQSLLALRAELVHSKYKIPAVQLTPGEVATWTSG